MVQIPGIISLGSAEKSSYFQYLLQAPTKKNLFRGLVILLSQWL